MGNPKAITELDVQMQISLGSVRPQFPGIQLLTSKLQIFANGYKRLSQISGFNWLVKRQSSCIYKQDVPYCGVSRYCSTLARNKFEAPLPVWLLSSPAANALRAFSSYIITSSTL